MKLKERINRACVIGEMGLAGLTLSLGTMSCETLPAENRGSITGALFGTLAGAAIGAATGDWGNVAAGAAIGAGSGAVIGNEYDKTQMGKRIDAIERDANTFIINVHNTNGSITPVYLRRDGNTYWGPRGEMYQNIPTEDQLRKVYGF